MSSCPKLNSFCAKSDAALGLFRAKGVGYEYPPARVGRAVGFSKPREPLLKVLRNHWVGYKYPPAHLVGYEYPPARVSSRTGRVSVSNGRAIVQNHIHFQKF